MEVGLNLKETELCLGLPGGGGDGDTTVKVNGKRGFSETISLKLNLNEAHDNSQESIKDKVSNYTSSAKDKDIISCTTESSKPPSKAQVVGWPPVRSFRKNIITSQTKNNEPETKEKANNVVVNNFVKVSMDGAPYLRKVDLKMYKTYKQLSDALVKMFSSFTIGNYGTQGMIDFMNEGKLMDLLNSSEYVPTYEDKDGDWMLVGDVPWEMFVNSCKRLRIMKGSEAIGLAPRAMEKCKRRS